MSYNALLDLVHGPLLLRGKAHLTVTEIHRNTRGGDAIWANLVLTATDGTRHTINMAGWGATEAMDKLDECETRTMWNSWFCRASRESSKRVAHRPIAITEICFEDSQTKFLSNFAPLHQSTTTKYQPQITICDSFDYPMLLSVAAEGNVLRCSSPM